MDKYHKRSEYMLTELAKGVYWVGYVDWALRHFHGYELSTHRGSSYNAYLIIDEKTVLVDTVWGPFGDRLIENIREIIDPAKIDIVVANHAEMDHSGALPLIMQHTPNATVIVSKRGRESVEAHYHQPWNFRAVQTGDRVNIGKRDLVFIEAPMLHWPDSMFTYVTGDNILISNDAFGHHYATANRFNDEVDRDELYAEALKYYANILTPFSSMVLKKIDEVLALNLPVDMIAPSHGIIWRQDPLQIVEQYRKWAAQSPEKTAVIIFDTMWDGTRRMAESIGEGLLSENIPYKSYFMPVSDHNDVVAEIFKTRAVIIGSPTFNNGLLPP
jgi:anaerobic nitric oxide reductase flavorubredoxin